MTEQIVNKRTAIQNLITIKGKVQGSHDIGRKVIDELRVAFPSLEAHTIPNYDPSTLDEYAMKQFDKLARRLQLEGKKHKERNQ